MSAPFWLTVDWLPEPDAPWFTSTQLSAPVCPMVELLLEPFWVT